MLEQAEWETLRNLHVSGTFEPPITVLAGASVHGWRMGTEARAGSASAGLHEPSRNSTIVRQSLSAGKEGVLSEAQARPKVKRRLGQSNRSEADRNPGHPELVPTLSIVEFTGVKVRNGRGPAKFSGSLQVPRRYPATWKARGETSKYVLIGDLFLGCRDSARPRTD